MTRNTAKIIGQVTAIVSLYFLARPQLPPHSAHLVFKNACGKKEVMKLSEDIRNLIPKIESTSRIWRNGMKRG